jgi:hypothetical protein
MSSNAVDFLVNRCAGVSASQKLSRAAARTSSSENFLGRATTQPPYSHGDVSAAIRDLRRATAACGSPEFFTPADVPSDSPWRLALQFTFYRTTSPQSFMPPRASDMCRLYLSVDSSSFAAASGWRVSWSVRLESAGSAKAPLLPLAHARDRREGPSRTVTTRRTLRDRSPSAKVP